MAQQVEGKAGSGQLSGAEPTQEIELPVGLGLAWRLRALILSGKLAAGERLPGVRDFAQAAGVNVNTARALYGRLESEGLVVSRHGAGTFVASEPQVAPELERIAAEAAGAAHEQGIDPRELARVLYAGSLSPQDLGEPPPGQADAQSEGAARRTLREQIARLEAELAAYPEEAAKVAIEEAAPEPIAGPAGRIADLGELEVVRDQLFARLKRVRAAVVEHQEARDKRDRMIEDPAEHKWEAVSSAELGEPGCATYQVSPAWGPIGALMNWWRVKVSGGCPLAGPPRRPGRDT